MAVDLSPIRLLLSLPLVMMRRTPSICGTRTNREEREVPIHLRHCPNVMRVLSLMVMLSLSACAPDATSVQPLSGSSGDPLSGADTTLQKSPWPVYLVGESITAGRAATSEDKTWRRQVEAYMAHNTRYSVFEQTTDTYSSGWKVADALKAVTDIPPRHDAAVLFIGIGTNDISGNEGATHITQTSSFVSTYAKLIATVRAAAPQALLVCFSVWWASSPVTTIYDTAIEHDCEAAQGRYLSLQTLFDDPAYHGPAGIPEDWYKPGWTTDTFHPNDHGEAAIAQLIESQLP